MLKFFLLFFLFYFLTSCSELETVKVIDVLGPPVEGVSVPLKAPVYSIAELVISASQNPILLTGNAVYESIDINSIAGSAFTKVTKPIRYAQISVFENRAGQIVNIQNSQTDAGGNFSFRVPQDKDLLLVIYARTQGSHGNLSVEDPCQSFVSAPSFLGEVSDLCQKGSHIAKASNVYALQKNINISSASNPSLSLIASFPFDVIKEAISSAGRYDGELLGGAFHILDRMIQAVDFLTDQVGSCTILGCKNFVTNLSKLPLLKTYWRAGFRTETVSSFYNHENAIFLLGGENKDPVFSDHDHFDAAVILHEFAHYLEDNWSHSDSLGGVHSGGIIDPRLAWSEGFANFFQAAVLNKPEYKDLYFAPNSNVLIGFSIPLENQNPGSGQTPVDILGETSEGEGNFREFSIARLLWDSFDSNQGSEDQELDNLQNSFPVIWASLTHDNGFLDTSYFLRSMGLFNKIVSSVLNKFWTNVLNLHKNTPAPNFRRQFGAKLVTCTMADPLSFTSRIVAGEGATAFYGDYLHNYDIFTYTHTGGSFTINVDYTVTNMEEPDTLKLIVVKHDSHLPEWSESNDVLLIFSPDDVNVIKAEASVTKGQVQQSVSSSGSLSAGTYMVLLIADSAKTVASTVSYDMRINNANICLEL